MKSSVEIKSFSGEEENPGIRGGGQFYLALPAGY